MKILNCFFEESRYYSPFFNRQEGFRYLIEMDGNHCIETGIYLHYTDNIKRSIAIDVSCMVGCSEKCFFCSSRNIEYVKGLTPDEMVEEILLVLNLHHYQDFEQVVIAFDGIGEPSLIPEQIISVARSMRSIMPDCAINISTTGANLNAFRLWKESDVKWTNLQISATDDSINDLNKIGNIVRLFDEEKMSDYFIEIKFNYVLIKDLNDKDEHLKRLISIFGGKDYIVKLSKLNNPGSNNRFETSPDERFEYFSDELRKNNVKNYRFGSLIDSSISCGQLVYLNNNQNG